jgi:hypothetical protein
MCRAIAEAYEVDEVKDIRDKAIALEHYARQARNTEAERKACEIRLRAERKCGELLRDMEKAKGTRDSGSNQYQQVRSTDVTAPQTLSDLGVSKQQSSDWQKLAAISAKEFEADLADTMWHPSTAGLIQRHEAREREPSPAHAQTVGSAFDRRARPPSRCYPSPGRHDGLRHARRRAALVFDDWRHRVLAKDRIGSEYTGGPIR